jgi:hypothetical protein
VQTNSQSSTESLPPLSDWPTISAQPKKSTSPRLSALPLIPKKKENGSGSKMRSRGKSRNRRNELLRRLDVDEEQLAQHPSIMPRLKLNGISTAYFIEVLRCDLSSPESQAFIRQWDKLTPADRSMAGLEAVGASVGMVPRRLWEVFAGAELLQSRETVGVMISMALPEVMRVTIRQAKKAKSIGDREHFLKIARALPTPKGSVTNINVPGQKEIEEPDEEDAKGDLEPADGFVLNAARIMNPQKALVAHKALDEMEQVEE